MYLPDGTGPTDLRAALRSLPDRAKPGEKRRQQHLRGRRHRRAPPGRGEVHLPGLSEHAPGRGALSQRAHAGDGAQGPERGQGVRRGRHRRGRAVPGHGIPRRREPERAACARGPADRGPGGALHGAGSARARRGPHERPVPLQHQAREPVRGSCARRRRAVDQAPRLRHRQGARQPILAPHGSRDALGGVHGAGAFEGGGARQPTRRSVLGRRRALRVLDRKTALPRARRERAGRADPHRDTSRFG